MARHANVTFKWVDGHGSNRRSNITDELARKWTTFPDEQGHHALLWTASFSMLEAYRTLLSRWPQKMVFEAQEFHFEELLGKNKDSIEPSYMTLADGCVGH
ncbi:hypothetical protein EVAR_73179_1 [Eumeta japonica]|uniref:Uncharacterized protein n=1 Tax=Eumeta variegata TaxID=151549 RepID=A0A4C1SAE2_EUMVA|nr:hypothetical protein EVAR_73179_1 [Eumeta japonica]